MARILSPAELARENEGPTPIELWARASLLALLAWLTWSFARQPLSTELMASFLHMPNLVFHEAGHVLFAPLGEFMTVLGGSLLQVLVPLILAGAFVRQRQLFSAAVCTWWAGQSLVDVAPYIADARALSLVLLGGKTGAEVEGHDWEFILTHLGLMHRDVAIGLWAHYLGAMVMVLSLLGGAAEVVARGTSIGRTIRADSSERRNAA